MSTANTPVTPMTDKAAIAVGYLLALASDVAADSRGDTLLIRRVADEVIIGGIAAGRGFINGVWHVTGNTRSTMHPFGVNATWKAVLAILADADNGVGLAGDEQVAYLGDEGDDTDGIDPRYVAGQEPRITGFLVQVTWNGHQYPTFVLPRDLLGITDASHAERIARDLLGIAIGNFGSVSVAPVTAL